MGVVGLWGPRVLSSAARVGGVVGERCLGGCVFGRSPNFCSSASQNKRTIFPKVIFFMETALFLEIF